MNTPANKIQDKRRRGPRNPAIPDEKGNLKRSFYIKPLDYKAFWEACAGNISVTIPQAIAAWMALDGNTQEFVAETLKGRTFLEAVPILREKLPDKMADMLLAEYVSSLSPERKSELIREARKRTR